MTMHADTALQRRYDDLLDRSRISEAVDLAVPDPTAHADRHMATEYALDLAIRRKVFPADMRPVLDTIYRNNGYLE